MCSTRSFELWGYLVSISGIIYFTCIRNSVFIGFSSLSIPLVVELPVSGRFVIRGNKNTKKTKQEQKQTKKPTQTKHKNCIFSHWCQYYRNPSFSAHCKAGKIKAKKQLPPIHKSRVNLSQQRAKVITFNKNFVAFHMQADALHLCSDDKTCPRAAGGLGFTLGKHGILKRSGFILA